MAIVLFDCDGVLVNTEEIAVRNTRNVLRDAGMAYTDEQYEVRLVGYDFATLCQNMRDDYFVATGQNLGEQFFDDMQDRYLREEAAGIAAITGVRDFVESLARAQVPFAICSNGSVHDIERKTKAVGLYDLFAGRILGRDNVANGKPAPDIYLAGMSLLGGNEPQKCVVIEDSVIGVRAGHAAGMRVMGHTGGSSTPDGQARKLKDAGAVFTAPSMAVIAKETFGFIEMTAQALSQHNALKRTRRSFGPTPL